MAIDREQKPVEERFPEQSPLAELRKQREHLWSLLDELDRFVPFATGEHRGPEATRRLAITLAGLAERLAASATVLRRLQRLPHVPSGPSEPASADVVTPARSPRQAEAVDSVTD